MTIIREPDNQPCVSRHHVPHHRPTHGSVHSSIHKLVHRSQPHPSSSLERDEPRVDIYKPRLNIHIDTTFWQHRSIFAGTQEQLNELRREADARAAARARTEYAQQIAAQRARTDAITLERHRPVFKRLKPIVHVGFVPMLWTITTCKCGDRWPCNDIKQYFRRRLGWTVDITEHLESLTKRLPKPATRWTRFKRWITRRNADGD